MVQLKALYSKRKHAVDPKPTGDERMNPQDHWLLQKERTLAWLRLGFSIAAILVVQLNPERIAQFPHLSLLSLFGFAIYSTIVLLITVKRPAIRLSKIGFATTGLDLAWVSLIVFSTGPSPTPFFVYYFFPVVTASSRYGIKGGVIIALIGVAAYGVIRFSGFTAQSIAIDIFVIRSIYLVVLAYIFGFVSEFEQKQNRRLIALNKTAGEVAAQQERRRIARELHDRMLQVLATLSLRLEACARKPATTQEELAREFALMQGMVAHSMSEIRQFLSGKNPPSLAPGTLIESLKEEMKFLRDGLGVHVILETEPDEIGLLPAIEEELYYVIREGLINIAKHSHATRAVVSLQESKRHIAGSVTDNGVGFEINRAHSDVTLGLASMEERIKRLGGKLDIMSSPGNGTTVAFTLPRSKLDDEKKEPAAAGPENPSHEKDAVDLIPDAS